MRRAGRAAARGPGDGALPVGEGGRRRTAAWSRSLLGRKGKRGRPVALGRAGGEDGGLRRRRDHRRRRQGGGYAGSHRRRRQGGAGGPHHRRRCGEGEAFFSGGGGGDGGRGPHTTSPGPLNGCARRRFLWGAIQRAAGGEGRSCAEPLRAAALYDPFRRICKRGRVRDLKSIRIDRFRSGSGKRVSSALINFGEGSRRR